MMVLYSAWKIFDAIQRMNDVTSGSQRSMMVGIWSDTPRTLEFKPPDSGGRG